MKRRSFLRGLMAAIAAPVAVVLSSKPKESESTESESTWYFNDSTWVDQTTGKMYKCTDMSVGRSKQRWVEVPA